MLTLVGRALRLGMVHRCILLYALRAMNRSKDDQVRNKRARKTQPLY